MFRSHQVKIGLLTLAALVLIIFFLYKIRTILTPFILAILMAYILLPIVKYLVEKKIPVSLAIVLVYLTLFGAIGLFIVYVLPNVLTELTKFGEKVPEYTTLVQQKIRLWQSDYHRFRMPESARQIIDEMLEMAEKRAIETGRDLMITLVGLLSYTLSIVFAPILAFYFLKDHELICRKITSFIPERHREEVLEVWNRINYVLRKFIRGHLIVASLVGILTAIGLSLIGMEFALLLGFIAGLADLIPYFGPFIGAVPAVLIALLQNPKLILYVILVMIVVQQLETWLITPKIIGDSVGLHPLTVVFVIMLGGYFAGVIGLLFAVPVTAVIRIIANFIYDKTTYRLQ